MRHLQLGVKLIVLSVCALLVLDLLPGNWVSQEKHLNSTTSYVILGVGFYLANYLVGSDSLEYFKLPRFHFKSVVALTVAALFMIQSVVSSDNVSLKPIDVFSGILFLLSIGFGEEMVSRGLVFGLLRKFGQRKAMFVSSMLFGLMHLNLYRGSNWDAWLAYWHVMEAFSFGILACALMIVTRSIWVAVVFHAICDWGIIFNKVSTDAGSGEDWTQGFWEGIASPLFSLLLQGGFALLILRINRASLPNWFYRLALKWKLVEPMMHSFASSVTSTKPNFL